jgi:pimeloyl-ACP methyl ester carboxylesterase
VLTTFADGTIFGSTSGAAPATVLALHGWARSAKDFSALMAPAAGAPLDGLALDLPGFGASPPPDSAWGSVEYATAVSAVLADTAPSIVIVGHSFGGRVAVELALQHPSRVRALVLTGVPLLPRPGRRKKPAVGFRMARRLHRFGLLSDARMETARQTHGSSDYRAAQGIMRDVLVRSVGENYGPQLEQLTCPVWLVWGAEDTDVPVSVAEMALAKLRHGSLHVEPGVGHLTPTSMPDVLRGFVERALNDGASAP